MEKRKYDLLVVDDSPLIIERLTGMLEELENVGEVMQAKNYEEAQIIVEEKKPWIVILDISLPDKNGIELLQYIKLTHPQIGVIMLTNQVNSQYKNICMRSGATAFLDKTKDFEQIITIVSDL